ncbi:sensor histidine kinase [Arthrobacter castelli]|uniref:sensor histidine kinase n=1 Tax=Arthrobacter castelli TaxID=271431 RepID=UPI000420DEAF|nr:sensor histidine kinase [Arthrobacter castelli]
MKSWTISRRFFAGQLIFVLCLTAGIAWVMYQDASDQQYAEAAGRMHAVTTTLANDPFVVRAVQSDTPTQLLQPYARTVMNESNADFITIMAPDRTRFTHRNEKEIGGEYIGSVRQALAGETYTETYTGTLGPSVRTIAPVFDDDGDVVALVSSGVTIASVSEALASQLPLLFGTAAGALVIGSLASWWISRRLRQLTLGLGPENLSRMFVFYDAVLHSVREGMVLVSSSGELVLYNDQAASLLNLPAPGVDDRPVHTRELELPAALKELLRSGRRATDELYLTADRILVVNQEAAMPPAVSAHPRASMGTVTTFRDHTEIEELTGELQTMQTVTDALRAQTHEHSNRLHTIVSLIELGRSNDAAEFAAVDMQRSQQLTDNVVASVDEPYLSALLVGKAAQANERGIELDINAEHSLVPPALDPRELVTILGNLLDNAFDAATAGEEPRVAVDLAVADDDFCIRVWNNGTGIDVLEIERIFDLGFSTKSVPESGGLGLALVRQACTRLGGEVTVQAVDGGAVFNVRLPMYDSVGGDRELQPRDADADGVPHRPAEP